MTSLPAHPTGTPHHDHTHDGAGCADVLDLDAQVFGGLLDAAVAVAVEHAPDAVRTVVDLGAGTGTGTRALARAFPRADVVAVDADAAMLDRLRAGLVGTGLADRVRTVEADLDAGWPEVGTADVVWASASLHHVADPAHVLRDARDALVPGGLLVVVEMTATSPVLPDDAAHADLAAHLDSAIAQAGWNRYPDWTPFLTDAGLEVVDRREPTAVVPPGPAASRWAHATAARQRVHLADRLGPDDLAALDAVLAATAPTDPTAPTTPHPAAPGRAPGEHTVAARGGRIVWAARRPR
ncbi:Methylase involved in ubiquinone/menaquinone biosynthesis [Cellulosimicrobium cellulans J34]|nr:Methylase involved in ubiquinone/menaquinone biosynthesis [Cellulosimicrobium cellulans J34]SMF12855.1 Methylase involved in ubiquinone/menaquinone biosynthesis [Cellulosimicrobium cellulans J1]